MKWTVVVAATALWACCCPAAALAQPVFFDDFDGPDFLPHWRTPDPARWEYNISGGMLHVTDLLHPSVAKLEANFAIIGAAYAPQSDFRLDVWMGWDDPPSTQFHELFVTVNSRAGILAEFGLISLGGISEAVAASGAGAVSREPPLPGMHQFTIARTGSQFDFYLDGAPFASFGSSRTFC